jgi:hypothetical protein
MTSSTAEIPIALVDRDRALRSWQPPFPAHLAQAFRPDPPPDFLVFQIRVWVGHWVFR